VHRGGDLGEVEQHLGEQLVHAVRHLQDARRQRHDAHLTHIRSLLTVLLRSRSA
jgi:hypothetical protein